MHVRVGLEGVAITICLLLWTRRKKTIAASPRRREAGKGSDHPCLGFVSLTLFTPLLMTSPHTTSSRLSRCCVGFEGLFGCGASVARRAVVRREHAAIIIIDEQQHRATTRRSPRSPRCGAPLFCEAQMLVTLLADRSVLTDEATVASSTHTYSHALPPLPRTQEPPPPLSTK